MGPQNDEDSVPAIHAALDHGLNWIDTAALYGLGHSEEDGGASIQGRTPKPYVFTKCERVWDKEGNVGASLKAESIRRECEDSLRRLKVDTIDLYQIHWPEPDEDIEEGWTELARLKEEGKMRFIGVSNFSVAQMRRAQAIAPITSLQPPYAMVRREIEKRDSALLPAAQHRRDRVFANVGRTAHRGDDARARCEFSSQRIGDGICREFQEPALSRNLKVVEHLREIGKRHGRTAGRSGDCMDA